MPSFALSPVQSPSSAVASTRRGSCPCCLFPGRLPQEGSQNSLASLPLHEA